MANPIKPSFKTEWLPILIASITIPLSFYFYSHFPDQVPTHWNFNGEIDGWSGKTFAAFFFPVLIVAIYFLMLFIPMIDPNKERYGQFIKVYHIVKNSLVIFMALLYVITGLSGIGYQVPINLFVPLGVGILFLIIGNYMGKIKKNWFIGIRTPWTLSSEEVWNKTHRLGGKLFMIAGLVMIIEALLPFKHFSWLFYTTMAAILTIPIVYSYLLYKKEKKTI